MKRKKNLGNRIIWHNCIFGIFGVKSLYLYLGGIWGQGYLCIWGQISTLDNHVNRIIIEVWQGR